MSCDNGSTCGPCAEAAVTVESVASKIDNLIQTLLGTPTKTIVDGRATWSGVCSPYQNGLDCIGKGASEGFICYLIRLMDNFGVYNGGIHDITKAYCKNTFVTSTDQLKAYMSKASVPVGIALSNTTYWTQVLETIEGPKGDQGDPGPAGSGSAINYSVRYATTGTALSDTDACLICTPAAPMTVTIPAIATLLAGKWFVIVNTNGTALTIDPNGAETIGGAATLVLNTAGESVHIFADATNTNWIII